MKAALLLTTLLVLWLALLMTPLAMGVLYRRMHIRDRRNVRKVWEDMADSPRGRVDPERVAAIRA